MEIGYLALSLMAFAIGLFLGYQASRIQRDLSDADGATHPAWQPHAMPSLVLEHQSFIARIELDSIEREICIRLRINREIPSAAARRIHESVWTGEGWPEIQDWLDEEQEKSRGVLNAE